MFHLPLLGSSLTSSSLGVSVFGFSFDTLNPLVALDQALQFLLHKHQGYFLLVPEIAVAVGALLVLGMAIVLKKKGGEGNRLLPSWDATGVGGFGGVIAASIGISMGLPKGGTWAWVLGFLVFGILFAFLTKQKGSRLSLPKWGASGLGLLMALPAAQILNFADLPWGDPKPWVLGGFVFAMFFGLGRVAKERHWIPSLALFFQLFSIATTFAIIRLTSRHFTWNLGQFWGGMETFDPFSIFWELTIDIIVIFTILLAWDHPKLRKNRGEFFALLMIAGVSLMFMVASSDLLAIYVMTEFSSITLYLLVGFSREGARSGEAMLKYFLVGVFSGILILLAGALFYGLLGTTNLYDIYWLLDKGHPNEGLIGLALAVMVAGLGYKIAVAPFHQWFPDAVEGSPAPVGVFLALAPKVAGFCVWMRIFLLGLAPMTMHWTGILAGLAAITMTVGNLSALHQKNVKRMLAFSSIAHVGFVLMAIVAAAVAPGITPFHSLGFQAALFYLFCYIFMNVGAFGVVSYLESKGIPPTLQGFRGLWRREAGMALLMLICLASLAGIPPTAGAWAKWSVFMAALETPQLVWLVAVGGLNTVIALYYYFKVAREMFLKQPEESGEPAQLKGVVFTWTGVAFATFFTLFVGLAPSVFFRLAAHSEILFFIPGS
ncbi:NADH-quinone oxidoreductase subunit N [bacterium]|nr:NADH-quinone oxidoreductase subunit N [bacterium]